MIQSGQIFKSTRPFRVRSAARINVSKARVHRWPFPVPAAGAKRLPRGKHNGVELLLIQSVDHVGKQGDVVEVKRGYAMNFLLPQGLATIATDHHKRMVEKHKAKLLRQSKKPALAGLRQLADEIAEQSVTIEANANDEGHLYGSVGAAEIVAALKRNEITVTADQVRLKGPLKELGLYTVLIHLGHEVEGELKVWVVPTVADEVPPSQKRRPEMTTVQRFDGSAAPAKVTSEILDRQPPRSLEAERAVLGSMLLLARRLRTKWPWSFAPTTSTTKPTGASTATCGPCTKRAGDRRPDAAGRAAQIGRRRGIRRRHGLSGRAHHVGRLRPPTPSTMPRVVRDKSTLRSLIHSSTEILRDAYDDSLEPREMLARAEQKIFSILDSRGAGESERHRRHSSGRDGPHRRPHEKGGHAIGGVETGFTDLDAMTGGLHDSELIILAARPSMGKTALALNIAEFVTVEGAGQPTLFVSLEMSSDRAGRPHALLDRRGQWPAAPQRNDFQRRSPPAGARRRPN